MKKASKAKWLCSSAIALNRRGWISLFMRQSMSWNKTPNMFAIWPASKLPIYPLTRFVQMTPIIVLHPDLFTIRQWWTRKICRHQATERKTNTPSAIFPANCRIVTSSIRIIICCQCRRATSWTASTGTHFCRCRGTEASSIVASPSIGLSGWKAMVINAKHSPVQHSICTKRIRNTRRQCSPLRCCSDIQLLVAFYSASRETNQRPTPLSLPSTWFMPMDRRWIRPKHIDGPFIMSHPAKISTTGPSDVWAPVMSTIRSR